MRSIQRNKEPEIDNKKYYDDREFLKRHQKVAEIGYVYVLKANNLYKIGKSKNVSQRIKQLQAGSAALLSLVNEIYSENYTLLEEQLHNRFATSRKHNEWFDLDQEALDFLNNLQETSRFRSNTTSINNQHLILYADFHTICLQSPNAFCCALLLHEFVNATDKLLEHNSVTLTIFRTLAEWHTSLYGIFIESDISKCLDWLFEQDYIKTEAFVNPTAYLLNVKNLQIAIDNFAKAQEDRYTKRG